MIKKILKIHNIEEQFNYLHFKNICIQSVHDNWKHLILQRVNLFKLKTTNVNFVNFR